MSAADGFLPSCRDHYAQRAVDLDFEFTQGFAKQLIRKVVARTVSRLNLGRSDRDDLEQAVSYELIRRSRHFDPDRGDWKAFTVTVVKRCLKTEVDRFCRHARIAPSSDQISDAVPTCRYSSPECRELHIDVHDLLDLIPKEERCYVEPLLGSAVASVAKQLNLPRSTYRDRLRKIRDKHADPSLKEYL